MAKKNDIRIRRSWGVIKPATRRIESKKRYVRARDKRAYDGS